MDRKALYIGTGLDLNIINKLFFIKDFVFIDSQPYSEFGKETTLYDYDYYYWQNNFLSDFLPCFFRKINGYHRPNFLSDLKRTAKNFSIALIKEECNKLTFYNHYHNQNIIYLINTSIPEDLSKISNILAKLIPNLSFSFQNICWVSRNSCLLSKFINKLSCPSGISSTSKRWLQFYTINKHFCVVLVSLISSNRVLSFNIKNSS